MLMREHGIAATTRRWSRRTTYSGHDRPVGENVVDRGFEPEAANRVWTADIESRDGWLYLTILDEGDRPRSHSSGHGGAPAGPTSSPSGRNPANITVLSSARARKIG